MIFCKPLLVQGIMQEFLILRLFQRNLEAHLCDNTPQGPFFKNISLYPYRCSLSRAKQTPTYIYSFIWNYYLNFDGFFFLW